MGSDGFTSPPPVFKTDRLLAVSEDGEDTFPVDPNTEFQALVNQNKWDQRFSGVDPMSWRGGGEDGGVGTESRTTEGKGLRVFTSTHGCTTLSACQRAESSRDVCPN